VGAASVMPEPPAGPTAPTRSRSSSAAAANPDGRPLPNHSAGHDGQARACGKIVERAGDRRAGANLREDPGELGGELAAGPCHDAVQSRNRALPRRDSESEELGDGRELRQHPPLPLLHLCGEAVLSPHRAQDEGDDAEHEQGHGTTGAAERDQHRHERSRREGHEPPQRLLHAEVMHRQGEAGPVKTAPHRSAWGRADREAAESFAGLATSRRAWLARHPDEVSVES
jgi:hypothetical protein